MSYAKIALFALAAFVVAGSVNADAAPHVGRSYGTWSSSADWHGASLSAEESLFQRAKGHPEGY
jgi:hypothetical protein